MTTVNKKLKKTASGAITWSVIVTQILSPVSLSLIPANSFASSGNKDVTQTYASDEHANKVASFAASAGQSLANNNASSFAVNTLSTQATKEVVDWLQQYGNARIKLNVDDSFSLKDSSFDFYIHGWILRIMCYSVRHHYIVLMTEIRPILVWGFVISLLITQCWVRMFSMITI